jgi:hypothetical protein
MRGLMPRAKYIWIPILIAATVAVSRYIDRSESVFLTAKTSVPVFATKAESMSSGKTPFTELAPNQRVPVLRCVDVKQYQIYKVRVLDGKVGYVNVGTYELTDKGGSVTSC